MSKQLLVRVAQKRQGAADVCVLDLVSEDGTPLPPYTAGSHIDLHLPGGLIRQYSLCSYQAAPERYQIAILREPSSRGGSQAVHDVLREGDTLAISPPRNLFELASGNHRALLLAGGIGITPILCMAEFLAQRHRAFELHYCGRSLERMAFTSRLAAADMSECSHLHIDDGPQEQRLNLEAVLGHPGDEIHLYVCGPTGFIDAVVACAADKGWNPEHIHFERFSNTPAVRPDGQAEGRFDIQLASTGELFSVEPDETVIEALARNGVFVETSCEQGICGTCLTGVKEGIPDHRDMYLSDSEKAQNNQFLPCCSRAQTPKLVLDL